MHTDGSRWWEFVPIGSVLVAVNGSVATFEYITADGGLLRSVVFLHEGTFVHCSVNPTVPSETMTGTAVLIERCDGVDLVQASSVSQFCVVVSWVLERRSTPARGWPE
jgi:hypothetical protein